MLRNAAILILLVPALAGAKPKAKTQKIEVQAGNGTLTLTFDPAKISEADLRAAAAWAPDSNPEPLLTMSLETCYDKSQQPSGCGGGARTPDQPSFLADGELTVVRNRAIVKEIADRHVAKELEPAKEHLRRHEAFWAGLEEKKLTYFKSWKTADLAGAIEGVDPGKACAGAVAKLDAAASKAEKYRLARFEWGNCANNEGARVIGDYPEAPWKAFLKATGVKATFMLPQEE